MRTYLSLLAFAIFVNVIFATLTMVFFHGQIDNANTFADYFYYAIGHLTTSGSGDLSPRTTAARIWTSLYVIVVWVYIFYVAVNHIKNIKFGRFG